MAEKKYYWLKMTDQFFEDKAIKKLRKIAGGDTYTIIYLKMLLTAIKQGNKMYFEGIEDDFMEELALELDEDTDNVKVTVSYLKSKGLIEVLGADEILLTQCAEMVGSETDGITVIETVPITSGSGGTSLGTMQLSTRNSNLNSMQEAGYGWNRWKYSAARQWLNSTQPKGKWWAKQDDWDIAPAQLAQKDGFLCGMPAEMLAVLKTVKVTTLANTVNDGGVTDITYDKVFLASMSQMNVNMSKEEGAVHEYWQRRTKSKTPIEPWKKYPFMIRYSAANHTSPQYVFSRSANRGYANSVMNVNAVGGVYGTSGWDSNTYAPLVFI